MSLLSPNLSAFMAVVKAGTVHGAAADLHLTQTGITQRIRSIERELGTTLFLRSRKGMKLTQEGEALFRYCKGAEELAGETLSQINGAGEKHTVVVTIVGPTSVMTARIVEQCMELYFKWPQLQLNFIISDAPDRISKVRSGIASLAIVQPELVPHEMDSKKLKSDKYILVATSKWKGRRFNEILEHERIIDFNETDSTTLNYLKKFNLISLVKRPRLFVNNNESIVRLFSYGVGFGTLTQEIAKPHLDRGDLIVLNGGELMEEALASAWYPRAEMPSYFKDIIHSIK